MTMKPPTRTDADILRHLCSLADEAPELSLSEALAHVAPEIRGTTNGMAWVTFGLGEKQMQRLMGMFPAGIAPGAAAYLLIRDRIDGAPPD